MPNPGSATPSISLAALSETVDLLGVVVAKMSDKLDQHGETLAAVQKAALESRDASQIAKAHTDPKRYASHIGEEVYDALGQSLDRLEALHSGFTADRQDASLSLDELVRQEEAVLQRLRADQERAGHWKKRIPFIALFVLVLVIGLSVALPRFLADSGFGCGVIGGAWTRSTTEAEVCVFYSG